MTGVLSSTAVSLLSNLELPLVEFVGSTPYTVLEVCSAHKDKVEIKCMGSVGGKTPTEQKLYLLFSSLKHVES